MSTAQVIPRYAIVMRWAIAAATLLSSCAADENPPTLTDTTGNEVGWSCAPEEGCSPEILPGSFDPGCPEGVPGGYGSAWGRFFSLWTACEVAVWDSGDERLVACRSDDECPNLFMYDPPSSFECVNGLCQNEDVENFPRDTVSEWEVELLCFDAVPREDTRFALSEQVQRVVELARNACSGGVCQVPADCRQP